MNENVNPDNVNPHFQRPEEFGLKPPETQGLGPQPCHSCGHCPTCGRGPAYYGPYWYYNPFPSVWGSGVIQSIPCTFSESHGDVKVTFNKLGDEPPSASFGMIS